MAARRWTIVCAAVLLAGTQLFPAWLQARAGTRQTTAQAPADDNTVPSDLRPLLAAPESELRLVTQRYNTDRTTLNGNYDGGRGPGRGGRGGDGRGRGTDAAPAAPAAAAGVALAQPDRAAETLRPELAGGAGENRLEQAVHHREGRPRDAESGHSDQPGCSRRRRRYRRTVDAARALRPGDRQAERVPHPHGGRQLAAIGRRAHRADAGHRAREGPRRGRVERRCGK